MIIASSEKRDEVIRLRAELKLAGQSRHVGEPDFSYFEESCKRLDDIYGRAGVYDKCI